MKRILFLSGLLAILALTVWYCSKDDDFTPAADEEQTILRGVDDDYFILNRGGECTVRLRTQAVEDWSATPADSWLGAYLHERFDLVFGPAGLFGPRGLVIGCEPNTYEFSSAKAVSYYLSKIASTGTVAERDLPGPELFAGELTALALNLYFDQAFDDFGYSQLALGEMIIHDEKGNSYDGWTVTALFKVANEVYGQCLVIDNANELYWTMRGINLNYRNGKTDNGYLWCPLKDFDEQEEYRPRF